MARKAHVILDTIYPSDEDIARENEVVCLCSSEFLILILIYKVEQARISRLSDHIRLKVRPLREKESGGLVITSDREEKVDKLIQRIQEYFPNYTVETLYTTDEGIDEVDKSTLVHIVFRDNETVYFGQRPELSSQQRIRMYQKEILEQAMKKNMYVNVHGVCKLMLILESRFALPEVVRL